MNFNHIQVVLRTFLKLFWSCLSTVYTLFLALKGYVLLYFQQLSCNNDSDISIFLIKFHNLKWCPDADSLLSDTMKHCYVFTPIWWVYNSVYLLDFSNFWPSGPNYFDGYSYRMCLGSGKTVWNSFSIFMEVLELFGLNYTINMHLCQSCHPSFSLSGRRSHFLDFSNKFWSCSEVVCALPNLKRPFFFVK